MNWRAGTAAALCALLTACAAPPLAPSQAQTAVQQRRYADAIELAGRMSLQYRGAGGEESLHGSFQWSQTPQRTRLTLLSPLGQTLAIVEADAGGASLSQAGQPLRTAADPDALVQSALGWPLPVAGLRDWLQGFARDAAGRPWVASAVADSTVTTDSGWHITYAAWQQDDAGGARPRRIDLRHAATPAGPVALRLVIDQWQASSAAAR